MKNQIIWTSRTIYVDLNTGEKLEYDTVKRYYTIHKKHKHAETHGQYGYITFTAECRPNQQGELFN